MLTLTAIQQLNTSDATELAASVNAFYLENEISDTHVAKTGQIDGWFVVKMPKSREEEYDAGDTDKQNKFAKIGAVAVAEISISPDKTFLIAWEEEYTKIFG